MDEYRKDTGDLKVIMPTRLNAVQTGILDFDNTQCILLSRIKDLVSSI